MLYSTCLSAGCKTEISTLRSCRIQQLYSLYVYLRRAFMAKSLADVPNVINQIPGDNDTILGSKPVMVYLLM